MNSPANVQINNNGALQDFFTISDIVDFGENSNGTYIKFSNGYQIICARPTFYFSSNKGYTVTFASQFIDTNYRIVAAMGIGIYAFAILNYINNMSNTQAIIYIGYSGADWHPSTGPLNYIAIGKYK